MKRIISSAYVLLLSSFYFAAIGFSQQASVKNQRTVAAVTPFANTAAAPGASVGSAVGIENIHYKAIADFKKKYKTAADVKWYVSGKVNVASFNDEGKHNTVVYHDNGKWLHTMINYDESQLDDSIRDLVNRKFRKYSIAWVTEVHEGDMLCYFIKVENEKRIKELIVYDGQVVTHKSLVKVQ